MKLSTRTRYGVRLMIVLAQNFDKGPIQLNSISESQEISEKYLSLIVIPLRLAGLINSVRGAQGGYYLTRKPELMTMKEIIDPLEGGLNIIDCLDNAGNCKKKHTLPVQQTLENSF